MTLSKPNHFPKVPTSRIITLKTKVSTMNGAAGGVRDNSFTTTLLNIVCAFSRPFLNQRRGRGGDKEGG